MSTASAVSRSPSLPTSPSSYTPTDTDHLIFRWVKLEGQSQSWVASQFDISQSTVSRIIQRYERWQAHASEREGGRLDHAERLRYQRWLTFERNELIMASCLRIAEKLEGFVDSTKSTTSYPQRHPQDETKVRTEHFTIDRTGSVARFLRLAFRINMEQLKLSQLDPAPPPPPLTHEELAHQDLLTAEIQADFAAAKVGRSRRERPDVPSDIAAAPEPAPDLADLVTKVPPGHALTRESSLVESPTDSPTQTSTLNLEPQTLNSPAPDHSPTHHAPASVHNLHNENQTQIPATASQCSTCAPNTAPPSKSNTSRITEHQLREGEAPAEPPPTASGPKNPWRSNAKSKLRRPITAK